MFKFPILFPPKSFRVNSIVYLFLCNLELVEFNTMHFGCFIINLKKNSHVHQAHKFKKLNFFLKSWIFLKPVMKNNNILFHLSQFPKVMILDFLTLFFCKLSLCFLNNMLLFLKINFRHYLKYCACYNRWGLASLHNTHAIFSISLLLSNQ